MQRIDSLGHGDRQRGRPLYGGGDSLRVELGALVEGIVQGREDGLLDFGAAVAFGDVGQGVEIEPVRVWRSGRSTKKISSKRPLRSNSGGSASISLAVATRNTPD